MPSPRIDNAQLNAIIKKASSLYLVKSPAWAAIVQGGVKVEPGNTYTKTYYVTNNGNMRTIGPWQKYQRQEHSSEVQAVWQKAGYTNSDLFDGIEKAERGGWEKIRDWLMEYSKKLKRDFKFVMQQEVWNGDGATLNNGGGRRFEGITTALSTTPTTGTYAGINRASYSGWQNYQLSGTAGPTLSFAADVWERIMEGCTQSCHPWEEGTDEVDLLIFTKSNHVIFRNKTLTQNTIITSDDPITGKGKVVDGKRVVFDENAPANTIHGINTSSWQVYAPQKELIKTRRIVDHPDYPIGNEAHDMEIHGALACIMPRNNFVMTNAA